MAILVALVAIAIFAFTWISIQESRSDAFSLLVRQSTTFTESLAQTAESAIASESFYDFLVQRRFHDIAITVLSSDRTNIHLPASTELSLARQFRLPDILVFRADSLRTLDSSAVGAFKVDVPDFVMREARDLALHPSGQSLLLLDPGEVSGQDTHYYLEISNDLRLVVILVADASYYSEALQQTQIGFLAQKLAGESGIAYIMYQTPEGIVFSSRRPGSILAIESDTFLANALEGDSAQWRRYQFQEEEVLEIARPFAGGKYHAGLLRVGFTLDGFYDSTSGYDTQMIIFAIVLFALIVVVVIYLNSRQRHTADLAEMEQKTQRRERLSEMGNLAAGVAHEIRNPLNTISIAAQRLASEFAPVDNREEFVRFTDQIRTETRRLNDIITKFLALSRQEEKKRTVVRLDQLISQIAELQRIEATELGVTYSVSIDKPVVVYADADQLRQVFSNLFNNAKEAMGSRGGEYEIAVRIANSDVAVEVSDSGPGIPEELRDKIFTPYYTTKDAGTGLGLSTVHTIVTGLDGDIRCESSRWGGAKFVMTFKRADFQ
ncbi:MAG: ATP-binding protein [Candidatus Zixiibacteriota bacterium]